MELQETIKDMGYTDLIKLCRIIGLALDHRCSFSHAYSVCKLCIPCIHDSEIGELTEHVLDITNTKKLANCLVMASLQVYAISDARQKSNEYIGFLGSVES